MVRRRAAILVLAGLALAIPACDEGTGPQDPIPYFPLAVGNSWTYAPEDPVFGDPFPWTVTERRGDTVALVRPWEGSHQRSVTLLDRGSEVDMLMESGQFAPFYRFAADTPWVHRDPWECDDGAQMVVAVVEPEPLVTPAGTFRACLRIERRSQASCTDAGTMVEWWAPGVGLVRWEALNYYAGGPIWFELTDYTVGP